MSEIAKAGDGMPDIGELNIGEVEIDDESGAPGAEGLEVFDVDVDTDLSSRPARDEFAMDVLAGSSAGVDEDGTIVADVVSVTMDEETGYAVIEEVVGIVTPDGTEITEETVSVLDPEGNLAVLADDVAVEGETAVS